MRRVFAGVDCGATNLRVGLVDEVGRLLASSKISSPLKNQPENFAKIVKEQIEKLLVSLGHPLQGQALQEWNGKIIGMGVGTPGPLDLEKGLLLPSANIGNSQSIDLKGQFDAEFSLPIYFDRDTNVALLGEAWVGEAKDANNVVMLTLGTGVGGAIIVNGEINRGENGQAGEIGHTILFAGGSCPSGVSGASSLAGSLAVDARDLSSGSPANNTSVLPTCGLGHKGCLEALINSAKSLDELGTYLGYGLANITSIFNPDKIIIGGGKTNRGDFLPKAVEIMKKIGMKLAASEVEVLYAKLGDESGIYGGAWLALQDIDQSQK